MRAVKSMELDEILQPIKRWWWLILLSTALAATTSYLAVQRQPDRYATRTTLISGSSLNNLNPSTQDFQLATQLASLYADVARREPIREATKQALGLSKLPEYAVTVPTNGQFIEIVVTDTDPRRAQAVANELANQLLLRVPEGPGGIDQERQAFAEEQLDFLEEKIRETETAITDKQIELAELTSAEQIAAAQTDLNALQTKLTTLQSNYAALLTSTNNEADNTISVIEPAELPTRPMNQDNWLYILLSATLGFVLGAAASYGLEHLDTSLKDEEDVRGLVDVPILARLNKIASQTEHASESASIIEDNFSPEHETFRLLRVNLEFGGVAYDNRSILVVSPAPGEGKSTVAANLAIAFAEAEKRTVLVNADLRKPGAHRLLGVSDFKGLTDILYENLELQEVVQKTERAGLWTVPAGRPSPDVGQTLGLPRVDRIMKEIKTYHDVMIVDGPPLIMADASVLASSVDSVLLVVRLNQTRRDLLVEAVTQLRRAKANIAGIVINDPSSGYTANYVGRYEGALRSQTALEPSNGSGPISRVKNMLLDKISGQRGPDQSDDELDVQLDS